MTISNDQPITQKLRPWEREMILAETLLDGEPASRAGDALPRHCWCSIDLTVDESKVIHAFVAHAANHAARKTLQKLLAAILEHLDNVAERHPRSQFQKTAI